MMDNTLSNIMFTEPINKSDHMELNNKTNSRRKNWKVLNQRMIEKIK